MTPEPPRDAEDELAPEHFFELREAESDEPLRERPGARAERAPAVAAHKEERFRHRRGAEVVLQERLPDALGRRADPRLVAGQAIAFWKDLIERAQEAARACGGALRRGAMRCASSCSFRYAAAFIMR